MPKYRNSIRRYQVFLYNDVHGTCTRLYTLGGVADMEKFTRALRALCSDDSCKCGGITEVLDKADNKLAYRSDDSCDNMVFRRVK